MSDAQLLILGFIICWISMILLAIVSAQKLRVLLINILINFLYGGYFLHGLFYRAEGGNALGWRFFLLCCLGIHSLISLVLFIKRYLT